jgi:hypothetical protein
MAPVSALKRAGIPRFAVAFAAAFSVAAASCKRGEKPPEPQEPVDAESPPPGKVGMHEVRLPLRVLRQGEEIRGEAIIARIQIGSGKKGGGLLGVLSPALRVDGASVETDGDSLSILADLPVALRTLVKMDSIEFRGLLVRSRDGRCLLECDSASVSREGLWEMRRVRRKEGEVEASFHWNPTGDPDDRP